MLSVRSVDYPSLKRCSVSGQHKTVAVIKKWKSASAADSSWWRSTLKPSCWLLVAKRRVAPVRTELKFTTGKKGHILLTHLELRLVENLFSSIDWDGL